MQLFKLICLVFRAGDQNSGILWGTQLPKKMIAWAFKKLELHLIVNSRLLSRLWMAVWNQFRHRATYASRMVSARFVGLLSGSEGLSNRKLNYQCGFASFQAGMQKASIPAEKWKCREQQQQQNHQGASLEFVPFPFCIPLVWMNISRFLPGWLFCCLKIAGVFRWWLYIKSGRWRHPPAFELC